MVVHSNQIGVYLRCSGLHNRSVDTEDGPQRQHACDEDIAPRLTAVNRVSEEHSQTRRQDTSPEALGYGQALVEMHGAAAKSPFVKFSLYDRSDDNQRKCGPVIQVAVIEKLGCYAFLTLGFNGFGIFLSYEKRFVIANADGPQGDVFIGSDNGITGFTDGKR